MDFEMKAEEKGDSEKLLRCHIWNGITKSKRMPPTIIPFAGFCPNFGLPSRSLLKKEMLLFGERRKGTQCQPLELVIHANSRPGHLTNLKDASFAREEVGEEVGDQRKN